MDQRRLQSTGCVAASADFRSNLGPRRSSRQQQQQQRCKFARSFRATTPPPPVANLQSIQSIGQFAPSRREHDRRSRRPVVQLPINNNNDDESSSMAIARCTSCCVTCSSELGGLKRICARSLCTAAIADWAGSRGSCRCSLCFPLLEQVALSILDEACPEVRRTLQ